MAFATGSQHSLQYVAEASYGVLPTGPSMIEQRHNAGVSLQVNKDALQSEEIRSDRQIKDFRQGNEQIGGDIPFELAYADMDSFIEAALQGTWASNVVKAGATARSFQIERQFVDITQYLLFSGCRINTFSLDIKPNQIVTGNFGVVGKALTVSGSAADASPTAAAGGAPFDSFTGTMKEGGTTIAIITGLEFSLDNAIEGLFVIGSSSAQDALSGRSNVTGTVTAFFQDATLLNKFLNETITTLQVVLTDAVPQSLTFDFNEVKYTGAEIDMGDEGPIEISLPFQAIRDTTDAAQIKITRTP